MSTLVFAPGARRTVGPGLVRILPEYTVQGPGLFVVTPSKKNLPLRVALLRELLIGAYAQKQ